MNIGSISSFVGQAATPAYTTSKAAVLGLSRSIALDYAADGVLRGATAFAPASPTRRCCGIISSQRATRPGRCPCGCTVCRWGER